VCAILVGFFAETVMQRSIEAPDTVLLAEGIALYIAKRSRLCEFERSLDLDMDRNLLGLGVTRFECGLGEVRLTEAPTNLASRSLIILRPLLSRFSSCASLHLEPSCAVSLKSDLPVIVLMLRVTCSRSFENGLVKQFSGLAVLTFLKLS
jgi:hypothetical protein